MSSTLDAFPALLTDSSKRCPPAVWIFSKIVWSLACLYTLAVVGVMVLRRRQPNLPRPYRTWGYPVTPLLYSGVMICFIVDVCLKQPTEALFGFGLLALGLPLYRLSSTLAE